MNKTVTWGLVACSILCLALAGGQHDTLLELRSEYRLGSVDPPDNAPPMMAFTTVLLGGFRGLIADMLWLRASYLQDEREYLEIVQLADWITKLEPRCTDVWGFHAWNMAYNVSIMTIDPETRWSWVRHGISLLRDEGIVYNPGDPKLYFELGWMFQHKIAGLSDRANPHYKRKWAEEMTALLGGPHPDYGALRNDPAAAQRMEEDYKLVPEIMRQVDDTYGPFDWRLPETHALYWAHRGRTHAGAEGSLWCDRMIMQCLAASFMQGHLYFRPEDGAFFTGPNLDILDKAVAFHEKSVDKYRLEGVTSGYINFLKNAVVTLYAFNREDRARSLFETIRSRFPENASDVDFETYVSDNLQDVSPGMPKNRAIAIVEGYCYSSLAWSAAGNSERAAGFGRLARTAWDTYLQGKDERTRTRFGLPTFEEIRGMARKRALNELPEPLRLNLEKSGNG